MKKIILVSAIMISLIIYSCNNTGDEPDRDTNTHNTSQSSPAAHSENIKIDARSTIPASRLNDGNLETRMTHRSDVPKVPAASGNEEEGQEEAMEQNNVLDTNP